MNATASLYQIDDRSLELRRSYMRVTRAELDLLAGMRAWADRNADAIGKALAEHTFSSGASGIVPARLRRQQGDALRGPQARLGRRARGAPEGDLR